MAVKKKTFEESLSRLGEIVRTLERGDALQAEAFGTILRLSLIHI